MRTLATAASVLLLLAACGSAEDQSTDEEGGDVADAITVPAAAAPITFSDACRAGTQITIAAVGDVLLHEPLQVQAYSSPEGHQSLWKNVTPLMARADLTYGNLEGPCADGIAAGGAAHADPGKRFDNVVYTSYPAFNYNPSLIPALKAAGFDVVSTANNHAVDRRGAGADKTIANLEAAGLPHTGTRPQNNASYPWYALLEAKGVKVAFIACTFSTNGIPDPANQVLSCYDDEAVLLENVKQLRARHDVDAVIVTPHWGVEYENTPRPQEKQLARELLEAGATAVLGNHPHVVQPMEMIRTTDGREGFVIYSLGNFVSGQSSLAKKSSLVLYLGLTKGADGKVTINGVRHMPLTMGSSPWTSSPAVGDSLALTNRLLGEWNAIKPNDPLVTNPTCGH